MTSKTICDRCGKTVPTPAGMPSYVYIICQMDPKGELPFCRDFCYECWESIELAIQKALKQ